MSSDSLDFLIDLGDTWMTDKYRTNYKDAYQQYVAQRFYFGRLCHTVPLYLTLGNHDGESGQQLRKSNDNMASWSTNTRKQFYANPYPNGFYSGNIKQESNIGLVENYYAWEWGNTLFVVLDPFRFTKDNKDPWMRTLGEEQFQWLKNTLSHSKAAFKFIFIHNIVGGVYNKGIARGGTEAANLYEWGGHDTTGNYSFTDKRNGWGENSIHKLFVQYHVNAVFHGHDHLFVKQDLDGIVYQLLPQPGANRYGNISSAADYGYKTGIIKNAPGYLKVNVTDKTATVEFIQTAIDGAHKTNRFYIFIRCTDNYCPQK